MKVYDLPKTCISKLKANYLCENNKNISWGELAEADNIPDEVIFAYYSDVDFDPDDFCDVNEDIFDRALPVSDCTVRDFIKTLSDLPEEVKNLRLCCCGLDNFWINIRNSEEAVVIDTDWLTYA